MPWNRPLIIALLVLLLALTWWRMQPKSDEIRHSRIIMGTVVEIVAAGPDSAVLESAVNEAFAEIERLDRLLSRHREESEVSLISRSEGPFEVTAETAEILALGLEVAERSHGAFDMSLGQLKSLWKFNEEAPNLPDREAISKALQHIGPQALNLKGRTLKKSSKLIRIDLGGIAKGYAVDRAAAILNSRGVLSAAINAGGDMYLLGQRPARKWRIGVKHPRQQKGVLETVQVANRAVVTSGDYERFFELDGERYHHVFDPRTGYPARKSQSVTIIAETVALADALATAVFVLGPDAGLKLLKSYPQAEALVVAADGTVHTSKGWSHYRVEP